jgi:cytochrome c oxidase subunit 1
MVFGFMYYLGKPNENAPDSALDVAAFWGFVIGTLGFTMSFLYSGKISAPRRYAEHLPEWVPYDKIASYFVMLLIASVLVFIFRFLTRLGLASRDYQRASLARSMAT